MSLKKQQKSGKVSYIFTRETMGMTLLLFSAIVLLILFTRDKVFAGLGREICTFMYGLFGYGAIPVSVYLAYLGVKLTFGKKIEIKRKYFLVATAAAAVLFLLFHSVITRNFPINSYGEYLSGCYSNAAKGWSGYTIGGAVCGLIVYPVAKLTTFIGTYVIFSALFVLCGYLMFLFARRNANSAAEVSESEETKNLPRQVKGESAAASYASGDRLYSVDANQEIIDNRKKNYPYMESAPQPAAQNAPSKAVYSGKSAEDEKYSRKNLGRKILFENGEFDAESYRRNMIFSEDSYFNHPVDGVESYLSNFKTNNKNSGPDTQKSYTQNYQDEVIKQSVPEAPSNYVYGEKPVEKLEDDFSSPKQYSPPAETFNPFEPTETYTNRPEASQSEFKQEVSEPKAETPRSQDKEFIRGNDVPGERGRNNSFEDYGERRNENIKSEILPRDNVSAENEGRNKPEENSRSILSSLFSRDSRRGENRDNDSNESRGERSDSKVNLFDDNSDTGDDFLGLSPRGGSFAEREEPNEREVRGIRNERIIPEEPKRSGSERDIGFGSSADRRVAPSSFEPKAEPSKDKAEPPKQEKPKHVWKKYVRPPLDLLDDYPENNNINTGEIEENKRVIVDTLEKFKIESEVANVTVGPAITRYDVMIFDRTNIKRSLGYRDEIALALMKNNVNAYLNYAKGALSIEIPNNKRAVVGLKTMLASPQFINCKVNSLTFGLGKNVDGEVVCPNITKMPHLLVAGTTGSGKSICLNSLLISLLYKYGPEELRLILVDPKQAEFIPFARLPHLMINEILYDIDKVIKALNWAIKEMERRYTLFKEMTESGVATKNLDEYNEHLPEGEEKLPKILIVLDEFGDLMMQAKKEIEMKIIRLAQKARACGIHLILATQRPSVDCITGLIKSNLPSRIGFKVNSFDDSRTIFDIGGAEKLLGMGDLYFRSPDRPELERIQGCFIDSHEVQKVTDFVKAHNETYFDQDASDFINKVEEPEAPVGGDAGEELGDGKMDDTYLKALKYCVASNQASVSMIQRRFPVGYIKACKIIDWMEKMNYITQSEGSKPRKVLMSMDEFTNTYGDVDD